MYLEIVTPEEKLYSGEVDVVTFPGVEGSFQVLNNHAPLISTLAEGTLKYKNTKSKNSDSGFFHITGGVVEVMRNNITVLVEGTRQEA